jgi:uncharacterized phage protein gp47/JayE
VTELAPEIITTPDSPGYVDLSLYDADEEDLVDRAISDATVKMPDWIPREGHTEVVLIEALALLVSESVYALNRLPAIVLQALLVLYGIQRDGGQPTGGRVLFTLSDTFGHTIPGGTHLRATVAETGEEVDLVTAEPLEILSPDNTGQVEAVATQVGDAGNGLAAGTVLELIDAVPYVNRVELVNALSGGRDAETDTQLYDRGSALLSRLVSTLVLPPHFTAAALQNPSVGRATTVDRYDPGQAGSPGAHAGHVTIAVADANGLPLSTAVKNAVSADIATKAIAGLALHVVDPTTTTVAVAVTVTATISDTAKVQADVTAAIQAYLDPKSWGWGASVYRNEVIGLVDRVPGVGRVVTLTLAGGSGDVALAGVAPLAKYGVVTVTIS